MKLKTAQFLTVTAFILGLGVLDCCVTSLYWQHLATQHHAAHFEADSWGLVSFHWHDEYAQTPLADPVNDSLTPPTSKNKQP